MDTNLNLTLAAGDYESIRALKEGIVKPDGIKLTILTDMTAEVRHARMLRGRQFDVAELSMSNYMVAKDNRPAVHRDPGVSPSPLSPRLRVRKHK